MAIHHPMLCTSWLRSASLQVEPQRALHLECKSTPDKFMITQKLGEVFTPSRHRGKHGNNNTICPKGEGKNKGKKPMHPSAPRPPRSSTGGGEGYGHHQKGTPAPSILPINHHININRHLWKPHTAGVSGDIVETLEATPDVVLMGKEVPEWFLIEMQNDQTKCVPHWKNVEWTVKDRLWRKFKDIVAELDPGKEKMKVVHQAEEELDSKPEKMKVVHQAGQEEEELDFEQGKMKVLHQGRHPEKARHRQLEEEVKQLREKQTKVLELVLKLQADMVGGDQLLSPKSLKHKHPPLPPHKHPHPTSIPPPPPTHPHLLAKCSCSPPLQI